MLLQLLCNPEISRSNIDKKFGYLTDYFVRFRYRYVAVTDYFL
jgi:hypothetical protein